MNGKSVKYLIMQDLIVGKKRILTALFSNLIVSGFTLLVMLSIRVGNLGKYFADYLPVDMIMLYALILIILIPVCGLDAFSVSLIFDVSPKWKKYRLSTPATPLTFAASKYLLLLLFVAASAIFSSINILLAWAVGNTSISFSVIKFSAMIICVFLMFIILFRFACMWFGNADKAGIACICVLMPIIFLIYRKISGGDFENVSMGDSQNGLAEIMQNNMLKIIDSMNAYFIPVVITTLMVFVLGFLGTVYIYGKKEK